MIHFHQVGIPLSFTAQDGTGAYLEAQAPTGDPGGGHGLAGGGAPVAHREGVRQGELACVLRQRVRVGRGIAQETQAGAGFHEPKGARRLFAQGGGEPGVGGIAEILVTRITPAGMALAPGEAGQGGGIQGQVDHVHGGISWSGPSATWRLPACHWFFQSRWS